MKSRSVERFNRTAEGYLRWWAPVLHPASVRLVERLGGVDPGLPGGLVRDVLDLGCGTGSSLFEAARRWPAARLAGLDGSVGMLDVARREQGRLPAAAGERITYIQADAAAIPAPADAFDAVMTCFVVQQVSDRPAVLREIHRVLRPGGILGIYGWLTEDVPFAPEAELEKALAEAGVARPASDEVKAGHYLSTRAACDELESTGYELIETREEALDHAWAIEDFIDYRVTTRDLELFETLDEATRQRVVEILRRRLRALRSDEWIYRAPIVSLVARRA
jgi:SAM-dependent methyltransferase